MGALPLSGADLLVHGSNLILLFAYTRRDMLWLRVLALAAAVTIVPYYTLQPQVLWSPLFWSFVYSVVHAYQIVVLLRERRPIELTTDERRLYEMSFPSLASHEFKRLMRLSDWSDAGPGTRIGVREDSVRLLFAGGVEASSGGEVLGSVLPGEFLGIAFQLEDAADGIELLASTPVRMVSWSRSALKSEMDASPSIGAAFNSLLNHDLARKMIRMAGRNAPGDPAKSTAG